MASTPSGRHFEPRPVGQHRAVRWLPLDDAFYMLASVLATARADPVALTRRTLLQVEAHLRADPAGCGILVGALRRVVEQQLTLIVVEGAARAQRAPEGQDAAASLAADLSTLAMHLELQGRRVVGWYRGDAPVTPHASLRDTAIHRTICPHAWQVALLRDDGEGVRLGGVVRVEPGSARPYCIPFLELVPTSEPVHDQVIPTAVGWRNYRAERDVVSLPESALDDPDLALLDEPRRRSVARPLVETLRGLGGRMAGFSKRARPSAPIASSRTAPSTGRVVPFRPPAPHTDEAPRVETPGDAGAPVEAARREPAREEARREQPLRAEAPRETSRETPREEEPARSALAQAPGPPATSASAIEAEALESPVVERAPEEVRAAEPSPLEVRAVEARPIDAQPAEPPYTEPQDTTPLYTAAQHGEPQRTEPPMIEQPVRERPVSEAATAELPPLELPPLEPPSLEPPFGRPQVEPRPAESPAFGASEPPPPPAAAPPPAAPTRATETPADAPIPIGAAHAAGDAQGPFSRRVPDEAAVRARLAWRTRHESLVRARNATIRRGVAAGILVIAAGVLVQRTRTARPAPVADEVTSTSHGDVDPGLAASVTPRVTRLSNDSARAAARFALTAVDEYSGRLDAAAAAIAAALDEASLPERRDEACARADSAFIRAMLAQDAIDIARRQLGRPLDDARLERVAELTKRMDDLRASVHSGRCAQP